MKDLRSDLCTKRLYFDGGFGTVLQGMGLKSGEAPETWNITHPDEVTGVHRAYIEAGSNIITTNTFGVNRDKYENYAELISAALDCAENAVGGSEAYIALDIGPTGRMLEPLGDLSFEEAVSIFASNVRAADRADLIIIETMNDCLETKAAVIAAKENSSLPIFVTNVYDRSGKLMTGADPAAMTAMLEGLGVDATGMNCSFGPDVMLEIIDRFTESSSLPLIANPNAGLPLVEDGKTVYDISAEEFADYMVRLAEKGVTVLGGCCGTTPEYIAATVRKTSSIPFRAPVEKNKTVVSSYTHAVEVADSPILIGERINPTGKPKLKEALRSGDFNYILNEGVRQSEAGAHILDVNVGLPEIDEAETMKKAVSALQAVTDTPLQLDSSSPAVLERAMRIYNGKALINSVNGEEESMNSVFPLVKKYGGTVIALTMDKSGIPESAEARLEIAERIARRAAEYGIKKKDILVDPLCLTVSSDSRSALVTLHALRLLRERGFKTSLGVSNISFGLPEREKINTAFFACALENGLNCAIMNPFSAGMTDTYYAFRALHGMDASCADYIGYAASSAPAPKASPNAASGKAPDLEYAVINGMRDSAVAASLTLLETETPLEIINNRIVPALAKVGKSFEEKRTYLPQLLMSAESASAAFEKIKEKMPRGENSDGRDVILATVKGDIHDIGKNIVRVLLESYGFKVFDLGRDVDPEEVCRRAAETGCRLVGLSALMTTTVPSMEETIRMLHERCPGVTVIVGGAVLNEEYAEMIHADKYCEDAMDTVRFAQSFYSDNV